MTERERFDLIDRYFRNELSSAEQETFQQMWATDEEFADEVAYHELVDEFILDAGLIDVKSKLRHYTTQDAKTTKPGSPSKAFSNLNLGLLAGFAALISVAIFLALAPGFFGHQETTGNTQHPESQKRTPSLPPFDSMVLPELLAKQEKKTGTNKDSEEAKGQKNQSGSSEQTRKQFSKDGNDQTKGGEGDQKPEPIQALKPSVEVEQSVVPEIEAQTPSISKTRADLSKEIQDSLKRLACKGVDINGQVTVIPTCKDKRNGKLKIRKETISGGEPPYRYNFSENGSFQKSLIKEKLRSGAYRVRVKDSRGCVSLITANAYIKAKECGKRSFTFVPSRESEWEFPFKNKQASGSVRIYNEKGEQVYRTTVNQGVPAAWRGRNNSGQTCSIGLYRVVLNPEEGNARIWLLTLIR